MKESLNFPFELIHFPLHADIACCGKYSSETCDFDPELKFPDSDFPSQIMSKEVLENFIAHYTEAQIHSDIHYYWRGGDPLLAGTNFFKEAITIQKQYAVDGQVYNHLHTPGIRINENWCQLFSENDFEISIDLDGPPHYNEVYRHIYRPEKDLASSVATQRKCYGTDRKIESLALLRQYNIKHYVITNVHNLNSSNPLETYFFLKQQGIKRILFSPVVVWNKNKTISPSVDAFAYGRFLITIFDYWIRHDVGEIEIINFEQTLQSHKNNTCHFAPTCGHHAYLAPNGEIFSCRHYTRNENSLGTLQGTTLTGLLYGRKQLRFGSCKQSSLTTQCKECPYLDLCHGGCPRNRHIQSESGQRGHSYLCQAYRMYFDHVLIPLKYLSEEIRIGHNAKRMREYYI